MSRIFRPNRQQRAPAHERRWGIHILVALLVGIGISIVASGYVRSCEALLDASPQTFRWAAGLFAAALALGPRLPQWLLRRVRGRGWLARDGSWEQSGADRDVWWTALGVIGLFTGVAVLLMPYVLSLSQSLYTWALQHFLWTRRTLPVLEVVVIALAASPLVALGLLVQCAHRLAGDGRSWDPASFAWVTCGLGIGFCVAGGLVIWGAGGALLLRAGAVPLFIAAMLVVWRAAPRSTGPAARVASVGADEPEIGQHWPMVLRLALAVAVAATLSAVLVWVYVVDALDLASAGWPPVVAGGLVVSVAAGLWCACRRPATGAPRDGAFGMGCALAGVALAAGIAGFNLVTRSSYDGFLHGPGVWLLLVLCAAAPMSVAGRALGCGLLTILHRNGFHPDAGAGLLQVILGSCAVACLCVALVLLEALGSYATLVALALALLATGGTLVIHDPYPRRAAHRLRLGAVFGGVVGMTFLMPEAGKRWLEHEGQVRGRLWESWWVTHEIGSDDRVPATDTGDLVFARADELIDWRRIKPDCRVGLISLFGDQQPQLPDGFSGRIDRWALLDGGSRAVAGAAHARTDGGDASWSALRGLRASPERFDVLLIALADAPVEFASRLVAQGLLVRARARISPDGVLICALPADEDAEGKAVRSLTDSSDKSSTPAVVRSRVTIAERACVVVCCGGDAAGIEQIMASSVRTKSGPPPNDRGESRDETDEQQPDRLAAAGH